MLLVPRVRNPAWTWEQLWFIGGLGKRSVSGKQDLNERGGQGQGTEALRGGLGGGGGRGKLLEGCQQGDDWIWFICWNDPLAAVETGVRWARAAPGGYAAPVRRRGCARMIRQSWWHFSDGLGLKVGGKWCIKNFFWDFGLNNRMGGGTAHCDEKTGQCLYREDTNSLKGMLRALSR